MAEPVFHNYKALRGLKTSGACLFNPSPGLVEDSPLPKYEVRGGGRKEVVSRHFSYFRSFTDVFWVQDLCSEDGKGKTMEILLNDNGRVSDRFFGIPIWLLTTRSILLSSPSLSSLQVVSVTDDAPPSPLFDELKFPLPAGVMPFEAWPPTRLVDPATGGGGPTERRPFWYLSQFGACLLLRVFFSFSTMKC